MIISVIVHRCPNCNSEDICKNGHEYQGARKYHCHRCEELRNTEKLFET